MGVDNDGQKYILTHNKQNCNPSQSEVQMSRRHYKISIVPLINTSREQHNREGRRNLVYVLENYSSQTGEYRPNIYREKTNKKPMMWKLELLNPIEMDVPQQYFN